MIVDAKVRNTNQHKGACAYLNMEIAFEDGTTLEKRSEICLAKREREFFRFRLALPEDNQSEVGAYETNVWLEAPDAQNTASTTTRSSENAPFIRRNARSEGPDEHGRIWVYWDVENPDQKEKKCAMLRSRLTLNDGRSWAHRSKLCLGPGIRHRSKSVYRLPEYRRACVESYKLDSWVEPIPEPAHTTTPAPSETPLEVTEVHLMEADDVGEYKVAVEARNTDQDKGVCAHLHVELTLDDGTKMTKKREICLTTGEDNLFGFYFDVPDEKQSSVEAVEATAWV